MQGRNDLGCSPPRASLRGGPLGGAVLRHARAFFAGAVALLAPSLASADPNDLALGNLSFYENGTAGADPRFVPQSGCGTAGTGYAQCYADNEAFANLMNELGGVLAPALLAPAGTIGYNGLYLGYEHTLTNVNGGSTAGQRYWGRGTEGSPMRMRTPGVMFVSRFHARKGFPMGFELGLQGSYLHDSSMVALGLDIRWAPFEGFRQSWGQFLPDLAFRGAVNTLAANSQAYLTVITVDASISKAFTLGGQMTLTPYGGAAAMMIFGDSAVVDATPLRSSYGECQRRVITYGTNPDGSANSRLECRSGGGTPAMVANDSQNELVFSAARILRWRGFLGARLRYGMFTFTAEFGFDASDPSWLGGVNADARMAGSATPLTGLPNNDGSPSSLTFAGFRQYSGSVGVGLTF